MTWGAPRSRAWHALKKAVLAAHGGRCHVCHGWGATEVDHIVNLAAGGTDDWSNLAPIHAEPCHREKTAREAAEGRERARRRRPEPTHPGMRVEETR